MKASDRRREIAKLCENIEREVEILQSRLAELYKEDEVLWGQQQPLEQQPLAQKEIAHEGQ